jgi:hypothetical protein
LADTYPQPLAAPTDPAIGALAINFSSDQDIPGRARAILLSTAGTLNVVTARGDNVSLILTAGLWPISITKIYSSGSSSAVGFVLY